MKSIIRFVFVAILAAAGINNAQAQNSPAQKPVYEMVEQMPEFPGGMEAMMKFISANIHMPQPAIDSGASGTVYISLVVENDGTIDDVHVLKDPLGHGCGQEAVRVVKLMPKWKPGKMNGREVAVRYTLPVKYVVH